MTFDDYHPDGLNGTEQLLYFIKFAS